MSLTYIVLSPNYFLFTLNYRRSRMSFIHVLVKRSSLFCYNDKHFDLLNGEILVIYKSSMT